MEKNQQRIAIAEACGWTCVPFNKGDQIPDPVPVKTSYGDPEGKFKRYPALPDYLNDLNAMHEAATSLCLENGWTYSCVVLRSERWSVGFYNSFTKELAHCYGPTLCPTLAEAFLRTIGKWVES